MKFNDYLDLRKGLMDLPATWYPALIKTMVRTAYKKKVFKPNHASVFIRRACEQVTEQGDSVDANKMGHSCRNCGLFIDDQELCPQCGTDPHH